MSCRRTSCPAASFTFIALLVALGHADAWGIVASRSQLILKHPLVLAIVVFVVFLLIGLLRKDDEGGDETGEPPP
jgi:hypothetical protein